MLAAPAPAAASAAAVASASSGTMAQAQTDGSETSGGAFGADPSRASRTENGEATKASAGNGAAASKSQRKRSVPKRATAGRAKVRLDPSPAPKGPRRKKRAGQPPVGSAKKKQNVGRGPKPLSDASASAPPSCLRRPTSQPFQHRYDVAADTDAAKKSVSFVSPSKGQVEVREFEMWQKPAGCAGCQRSVEGDAYVTCDRCEKNYHLDCCT